MSSQSTSSPYGDDVDCEDINSAKSISHHTVSTFVNNPMNNDPKCVFPTNETEGTDEDLFK